ncbi:MAG: hypothetical protein AAF996_17370 [Pseudomonadota bacterium]
MQAILNIRLFGVPIIATAIGSFILLSTMFMWYGGFFVDRFQPLMGIVEDDVDADSLGIWYPMGFVFCTIQGIGIANALKWRGWPGILTSAATGAQLGLFLGAMVFSYGLTILPDHNIELFLINASGIITAWTLCAVTMSLLRPREAHMRQMQEEKSNLLPNT